ncbi:MAG: helix-turn-helix transcriptional regulator [Ectothiorhodospiraceae bacterium]|nr:helix-turn-helix transcriptional regulator [Ectothiorhodospiraceae bacterium]MCH8506207.1 helix-turn-helix transcriptional regulator [Ectothiorhodospiraceae bacterium]
MQGSDRRSNCPIACTLDLIGDRWTLLVLRDLFLGKTRYDEFLGSSEGISTNILADRLRRLETMGMIEKTPYSSHRRRMQYSLTERGRSLGPVLRAIRDWGLDNVSGTETFRQRPPGRNERGPQA